MSDQSPAERHARVVGILKDRLGKWLPIPSQPGCTCSPGCRSVNERPAELQALIEIAERHDESWPCADFLSVERAVAENPGHPQPEGGE